jgi:hypothetical protein
MYRYPVVTGDRVALAPHLDLWMAGIRFGKVAETMVNEEGKRLVLVVCNERTSFWADPNEDLLGAVNPVPGQSEPVL